ncbi:MerR family transcriptional regulator [Novosphingobium cyanobacteriorum]|uniref:MerR family transcriptional regulator n=1 Tax=Novosphingobium cyanobacteriorum TaxID=3024215 RepID=A0ABT6CEC1_9SPHN|nr:MerR family transcriptional regulator [Novosphingobium cyanobacteriorum]MDF8332279.1 MerR family transcriptional regulator [Novosphingobium cyanobacteriorum]
MSASFQGFGDGKEPGALRTIGEVVAALGIKAHVLRYWEDQFPQLKPLTRAGGRRYYRAEDIELLVEIDRLLHREGYTIRGARQAMKGWRPGMGQVAVEPREQAHEPQESAVSAPVRLESEEPEDQIVEALKILRSHLEAIRDRLGGALAQA